MAYRLKTTGIAASCTMCIAVDPDTNTIKDFASATVTAGITVDAGITIGQQDWDGNTRKYIQLAANNFVNFTAGSQPSFVLGAAPSNRTIVWIGEAAGPGARVFGTSSSDYFYSQDTTTGLDHPTLYMGGTKYTGGMANIAAGEKRIFGFSLTRGAVSTAYTALHNAASMTSAATSSVGVGANWTLATIGRRTANTTQQNDKVHAILIFSVALTQAEWDSLRDDWFGVLLEVDAAGDTTPPTLTSPTGTQTGSTTATVGATTNEGNGTLYAVVTTSATAPTAAQVKAGQNNAGTAAVWAGSQAVASTGAKTLSATGFTASTTYYAHLMHEDAAANQSAVVTSASFTTAAAGDTTPPTLTGTVTVGTVTSSSIQITWPAGSDNVAVTSYETSPDGTTWTDRGNVLTYTFTGLTASTSYTLRVRAKDAAGNVSTPALSVTQSTSAAAVPGLTSSPLKANNGTLHLSAPFEAFVLNATTGALVLRKTGLTSHASTGVVTFTDAALTAATQYRVVWRRTDTSAQGVELLTAA